MHLHLPALAMQKIVGAVHRTLDSSCFTQCGPEIQTQSETLAAFLKNTKVYKGLRGTAGSYHPHVCIVKFQTCVNLLTAGTSGADEISGNPSASHELTKSTNLFDILVTAILIIYLSPPTLLRNRFHLAVTDVLLCPFHCLLCVFCRVSFLSFFFSASLYVHIF